MQNKNFFCTDCGCSNPIGFSFCAGCGKKFAYTCPDCNTEVTPDTKYCTLCGAELVWNLVSRPAPAGTSVPQVSIGPVEIKVATSRKPDEKTPPKQKKHRVSALPWIIIFVLIIIIIVLLLNIETLFK